MDQGGTGTIRRLRLSPEPASAGRAHRLVDAALREWELDHLADDVALGVSELVANAVLLAQTGRPRQFGEEGIVAVLRATGEGDAATVAARVEEAARTFVEGAVDDDMAVVVVRVPLPRERGT